MERYCAVVQKTVKSEVWGLSVPWAVPAFHRHTQLQSKPPLSGQFQSLSKDVPPQVNKIRMVEASIKSISDQTEN